MAKHQRIRDPVHNLIEFRDTEFEQVLWDVVQTRPFQRLRRIKQLGFSDFVYPGATHSRYGHSLGVFHTARLLMDRIRLQLPGSRYQESNAAPAIAAALVHDLGHGPFSHAFEDVGKRFGFRTAKHEDTSIELITKGEVADQLNRLGGGFAGDVAAILKNESPTIYGAVVSSQFDADRLDYMRQDRLMSGTGVGAIDFEWLMANLRVAQVPFGVDEQRVGKIETLVMGPKGRMAVESYVIGLFHLYPTVYFHKATRGAEKLFTELLARAVTLAQNGRPQGTGLAADHPLIRFAKKPDVTESVLCLDDTVIWASLHQMVEARDRLIRNFATRLRDRKLYKCKDVRELVTQRFGVSRHERVDRACAQIALSVRNWRDNDHDGIPRVLVDDEVERALYKPGPVNQIFVQQVEDGDPVNIVKVSEAVRATRPFRASRLYYRDEDPQALAYIDKLIRRETDHGSRRR